MNLVKTYLDKSPIEGIGLFAAEFIQKGTKVWKATIGIDIVGYKTELLSKLKTNIELEYFNRYMYEMQGGICVLCVDDARFQNHSSDSNTISNAYEQYAKYDIQVGEEITCNYGEINEHFDESEFLKLKSYKVI